MTSIQTGAAWIPPDLSALTPPAEETGRRAAATAATPEPESGAKEYSFFGDDGFSFADVLDVVNPLQHIPIVGTLYRALTGDDIASGPRMLGGALFGGPIGAALATADAILDESTGKDAGEHVLALFEGDRQQEPTTPPVAVAAATQSYAAPELAALAPLPSRPIPAPARREVAEVLDAAAVQSMPVAAVEAALVASKGEALTLEAIANPPGVGGGNGSDGKRKGAASDDSVAPGEPSAGGNWFSAAMMAALSKYEETRDLAAAAARPPAVSATY